MSGRALKAAWKLPKPNASHDGRKEKYGNNDDDDEDDDDDDGEVDDDNNDDDNNDDDDGDDDDGDWRLVIGARNWSVMDLRNEDECAKDYEQTNQSYHGPKYKKKTE